MPFRFGYVWIRSDDGSEYRSRLKVLETASRLLTQSVKLHRKNFHNARIVLAGMVEGRDPGGVFELFELYGQMKQKAGGTDKLLSQYLKARNVRTMEGRIGKVGEKAEVALPVLVRNWVAHPEDRAEEIPEDPMALSAFIQEAIDILRQFKDVE